MSNFSEEDKKYMLRAIELAKKGEGAVSPNPPVGCVLVKEKKIIAEGYHQYFGNLHAEAEALKVAGENAKGSTAYVTLSPCSHQGKQPACTDALIKAGVAQVIAAVDDPNPLAKNGLKILSQKGIKTKSGLLKSEASYVARGFLKHQLTGLPFLLLKYAMTLDGKIATFTGDSKWITGEDSRAYVHDLRSCSDAVMVGIGTALADDPSLNVRNCSRKNIVKQPKRVIVDSYLKLPPTANIFQQTGGEIIIITGENIDSNKENALKDLGAIIIKVPYKESHVDLEIALKELVKIGVRVIFCEGGPTLAAGLLKQNLIDEVATFVAAKIITGKKAPGPFAGIGLPTMKEAINLEFINYKKFNKDILLNAKLGDWQWQT